MKRLQPYVLVLVLTLINSCIVPVDIKTNTNKVIVISGKLTNATNYTPHVWIENTVGLESERDPIQNAIVLVRDESGREYPFKYSTKEQCYVAANKFVGEPGMAYQLEVTIDDNLYQSDYQRMASVNATDNSYFTVGKKPVYSSLGIPIDRYFVNLLTSATLPASTDPYYLRWDIEEVYLVAEVPLTKAPDYTPRNCYIRGFNLPEKINLVANETGKAMTIDSLYMTDHIVDYTFAYTHYFGVFQSSISKESFDYWTKVDKVVNRTGSLFEIPPAPIVGNVKNCNDTTQQVLGFFEVASMDTSAVLILTSDLPIYVGQDCGVPGPYTDNLVKQSNCVPCYVKAGVPEKCVNCLVRPHSTRTPPPYYQLAYDARQENGG